MGFVQRAREKRSVRTRSTEIHGRLGKKVLRVDTHVRRALLGKSNMISLTGVRMQLVYVQPFGSSIYQMHCNAEPAVVTRHKEYEVSFSTLNKTYGV